TASGEDFLLAPPLVDEAMRERRRRPMFFIDLAVPRGLDPGINAIDDVYLFDIDDLEGVIADNKGARAREAVKAETIIDAEVDAFWRWFTSLDVVPTIVALRDKVEGIRRRELARALPRAGRGHACRRGLPPGSGSARYPSVLTPATCSSAATGGSPACRPARVSGRRARGDVRSSSRTAPTSWWCSSAATSTLACENGGPVRSMHSCSPRRGSRGSGSASPRLSRSRWTSSCPPWARARSRSNAAPTTVRRGRFSPPSTGRRPQPRSRPSGHSSPRSAATATAPSRHT